MDTKRQVPGSVKIVTNLIMFHISTYLPRLDKTAKLKELTNEEYFKLCKIFHHKDDFLLQDFFSNQIKHFLEDKEIYFKLTCVEKFVIWLTIYKVCVSETISIFSYTLNDHISINIQDIINNVNLIDFVNEKTIELQDKISITLNAPRNFYLRAADEAIVDIIYSITDDGKKYYIGEFTESEKGQFLKSLPIDIFDSLKEFFYSVAENNFKILPETEKIKFEQLDINVVNNSLFLFLKSIFNIDLKSHYNNMLFSVSQFNSINTYFSITPTDFTALYKLYEANMKKDSKA